MIASIINQSSVLDMTFDIEISLIILSTCLPWDGDHYIYDLYLLAKAFKAEVHVSLYKT